MTATHSTSTPDRHDEATTVNSPSRRQFVKASAAFAGATVVPAVSYAATTEVYELNLLEASRAIRTGELTSERYTQALLERAHKLSSLNSFITLGDETVLEAARNADKARRAGKAMALPGVPIGVKDSYMTKGLPTSFGTGVAKGFKPTTDSQVVKILRHAGCLVFGKNNLVEMSYGLTGINDHHGQAKNPYNQLHITGGSSSGSAASVAARLVPVALGGDTVGSIRVPASLCGVVGFKPTPGRWSGKGVAPISSTLDTTGVLARRVADCELMDSLATGTHVNTNRVNSGLKGVRLAIAPRYYLDGADSEVEAVFNEAVRKLKDAGANIVEADLGDDFGPLVAKATWSLFFHETQPEITEFLRDQKVPVTFERIYEDLEPNIKANWTRSVLKTGPGYIKDDVYQDVLRKIRPEVQRRYANQVFARADALIFPTTLCSAPTIAEQWKFTVAEKQVNHIFLSRNTYPASCAALPGISLPMGMLKSGLPVGIELDASKGNDKALLQLARRVEDILGFVPPPSIA